MIMKHLLLFFTSWLGMAGAAAQIPDVSSQSIQRATQEWVQRYRLDAAQERVMYGIQEQRLRNLAGIARFQDSDYEAYLYKKRAIRRYVEAAVRRLLRPDQLENWKAEQRVREREKAALLSALKERGANRAEREAALLQLEVDWN